jgi:polyisoprenoid-binding protein YceI
MIPSCNRMIRAAAIGVTLLAVLAPAARSAELYEVDPVHSDITFKVRHLVSYVTGHFRKFSGVIDLDRENLENSSVSLTIMTSSVDTGNAKRDEHLRSDEFFDSEKFPEIMFKSKSLEHESGDTYRVSGTFSMHGIEETISIPVEALGFTDHARFGKRAGFTTRFTLDRHAYGIDWNLPMDSGTLVLGNEISIEINIEAFLPQE